ncbi:NADP-dependent oxidoreductase domain-containing protein [Chlamydoabsidia padenii]|nr:NADP-dependent oxidoreductase domain-containing protein [Chlamydoabsidia padenii]
MLSTSRCKKLLLQSTILKRTFSATNSKNDTTLPQRLIPKLNQSVTRLGFGGYRASDLATHGAALQYALDQGINLIDTGANFENGRSEQLVGDVLASSQVDRKNVTLVTKAGYLTKQDIERLDTSSSSSGGDDYVHVQGNSYHGISPRILADQLEQSLERLQTSYVDIFMINAPERMLLASSSRGDIYKQLGDSFKYLETLVRQGTIKGYGVCSNTMGSSHSAADHLSLTSILSACDQPQDNHFCAVQAPFNLYEQHLGQDLCWLDQLDAHGIFWLANRPLNAITPQGQIRGLYNPMPPSPTDMDDLRQAFERVAQLEVDMLSELPEQDTSSPFVWGQILSENLQRLGQHHFATQHYLRSQVVPRLEMDLAQFRSANDDTPAYIEWADVYQDAMHHLITCLVNYSYMDTLKKNNDLDRILAALVSWPPNDCHSPLTVKALQIYLANKDIGAIVTGMRQTHYVNDAMLALKQSHSSPLTDHQLLDINRVLV